MTEAEATAWLTHTDVPRETQDRLAQFVAMLLDANRCQNLIASSTVGSVWGRHIVDSAQLLGLAPASGTWVDLGSGAGLPGIVVALFGAHHVTLVESRALRVAFLRDVAAALAISNVTIMGANGATVRTPPAGVISARAVAPLDRLFGMAEHLADDDTLWLLPKGRGAASELAAARETWQGSFVMQPSITDPDAAIIVARHVRRRAGRPHR